MLQHVMLRKTPLILQAPHKLECIQSFNDALFANPPSPRKGGAAAGGQAGAEKALAILKDEMKRTMAYIGVQRTHEINADAIWRG